ncbi:Ig-like domain-containing protein [Desulfallas sp. Bu1-1]|uniref:Ig-like domain-containing protein n=1 Tax=Desulfallas sp. Bu1-1 TaxID=2787620 RepID=UPI00189CF06A|nr:Ig-like domain-containing protein [Desulfallas sp. Bu1-1]MBF7082647.1 Ig-like domain-containing protein [Desulfallas sp. Bu1-1]
MVTAYKSDGTSEDVTASASYQSINPGVAVVKNGTVTAVDYGLASIVVTYNGKSFTVSVTVNAPEVVMVDVSVQPKAVVLAKGNYTQLRVIETYSNGTIKDITNSSTFSSNNPSVATVTGTGLVTGVSEGATAVVVTYQNKTITVPVTVTVPTVNRPSRDSNTNPTVVTTPSRSGNTIPGTCQTHVENVAPTNYAWKILFYVAVYGSSVGLK